MFDGWAETFAGLEVEAADLHAGLNVAEAATSNYEAVAVRAAEWLPRPLALVGWSMGGLIALVATRRIEPARVVLLEASPPAEVQASAAGEHPEPGAFDPESVYGPFPPGIPSRPESSLARAERKRGVSVPELPCPALVVYGDAFPEERGRRLAARYGAEELPIPGASHWDLVLDPAVRAAVADRLS